MKKIWKSIAGDIWVVLLDVIAVNAAYYLALMIRFYVNFEFRPTVSYYLTDFARFAPFYTVLALIVFAVFRLYGGMWRYVGINDMNRIILANACTAAIHVLGTLLFIRRMPITYYVIGALLQFCLISTIRFSYRIFLVEKRKVSNRKNPTVPAMVIGAGETARKTIHLLEETPFRATVVVDSASVGKTLDGVQVIADYSKALSSVKAVFIADPGLGTEKRQEIKAACEASGTEVQDVTGYLRNLSGRIPVSGLLEIAKGPVTLVIEGQEQTYENGRAALATLHERYEIRALEGARIELTRADSGAYMGYEAWAQQHKEQYGEEISFF